MNYSLFILSGSDKTDLKIQEFVGNTDILTHAVAGAQAAVSDAVGFDVGDTYANKLEDERSVALTDNITEMTFNTSIITKTKYQTKSDLTEWDDIGTKKLKHTLTVKGNLEYPRILFALGVKTAQKKDTSKIWRWANTPLGISKSADKKTKELYYRHVVATVFSTDDRQFRAIVLKDAFVGSYEEYFDKNGEGHFTLVINKMIDLRAEDMLGDSEISVDGPEFKMTFSSFMGDIGKAAKTAGNLVDDAADVTEKIVGKNDVTKKMHKTAEGLNKGGDDMQKYLSDGSGWNPDDLSKDIDNHIKYVKETKEVHDGKEKVEKTENKPEVKYLPDGSTETTVTTTNPDGSKDIEITTEKKDKSKTVEKKHKDAPGYKDMDW